jgi:SAM-dependent methyltransferase
MMISNELDYLYSAGWQNVQTNKTCPDLAFWWKQASSIGHPILELGCGMGRISTYLAKSGCSCTGLDASVPTLCEAKKIAQNTDVYVDWVLSDLQSFSLDRQFALIMLANNTLGQFLENHSLENCLNQVRQHLWAEGRFIVEALSPTKQLFSRQNGQRIPLMEYQDENWNGKVAISQSNHYDAHHHINRVKTFYQFPGKTEELVEESATRIYYNEELENLLERNGFFVEKRFGDFDESSYTESSPRQILVCGLRS